MMSSDELLGFRARLIRQKILRWKMFDVGSVIESQMSQEDKARIETNINFLRDGFSEAIVKICEYVEKMGHDEDVNFMTTALLKRMVDLKTDMESEIVSSFTLIGNASEQVKNKRLDFYRTISGGAVEIIFHGVTILNFLIDHENFSSDDSAKEKIKEKVEDQIIRAVKICAVHGLNIKKTLMCFIDMKSASFMKYKNISNAISSGIGQVEPENFFGLKVERINSDEFVLKIGEIVDDNEKLLVYMRPYNPYGSDKDIINLIPIESLFIDVNRQIEKGYIPNFNKTNKQLH